MSANTTCGSAPTVSNSVTPWHIFTDAGNTYHVAPFDVNRRYFGYPSANWSIANSTSDGTLNTNRLVTKYNYLAQAASYCDQLNVLGYTDWYLPSSQELLLVYNERANIPNLLGTAAYWSSTEYHYYYAYALNMGNGSWISFFRKSNYACLLYTSPSPRDA